VAADGVVKRDSADPVLRGQVLDPDAVQINQRLHDLRLPITKRPETLKGRLIPVFFLKVFIQPGIEYVSKPAHALILMA
jgi:hypothetical protein